MFSVAINSQTLFIKEKNEMEKKGKGNLNWWRGRVLQKNLVYETQILPEPALCPKLARRAQTRRTRESGYLC